MTATNLNINFRALACVLASVLFAHGSMVYGQTPAPSQLPLLTKAGAAVAPNVVLTLDDSGSMQFQHMPENELAVRNPTTANPVASNTVRWDKNDDYMVSVNFFGTVPGIMESTNYRLRALRSADTNTVFYNPEIRYRPWLTSDGVTRLPDSPVAKAYKNPLIRTGAAGTYVDLTALSGTFPAGSFVVGTTYKIVTAGTTSFTAIGAANNSVGTTFVATGPGSGTGTASTGSSTAAASTGWCFANANNSDCAAAGAAFVHDPGAYFRLVKQNVTAGSFAVGETYKIVSVGSTNFMALGAASNTVGVSFKATGAGTGSGVAYGYSVVTTASNYTGYSINSVPAGTFVVGTQYKITYAGSTSFTSIGASSNAVGTVFTATGAGSGTGRATQVAFTKYADRIDCAGTVCTQDEERQNYANWFSYYRNRNLLARGSLMEAFGPEAAPVTAGTFVVGTSYAIVSVGSTSFTAIGASSNTVDTVFTATGAGSGTGTARPIAMRLGFGRINKGSATVDGVTTSVLESDTATYGGGGVRDFNSARKANLFKWLEDLPANGGTPLVGALDTIGKYYSRTDNKGPWTDFPGASGNVVANNKTCRRSYTILTTDGYWTSAPTVGNQDNTDGATITGSGASYKYVASRPYKDEWSDTLADVAMKYWKSDLQTATDNKVPAVANNPSFWQNMTTYTVGLGVRGTLDPDTDLPALTAGTKTWPHASPTGASENVDDLWHAAVNSRGQYFSAKDPQELATAIRTALAGATGGAGATAGVATASTLLSSGNRKYIPTFESGNWDGDITAYGLDATGQVTTAQWTASSKMPAWNSRNIVTFDNTSSTWTGVSFDWASIPLSGQAAMGAVAALHPTEFINYLKGDHSQEGVGNLYRSRFDSAAKPFVLGDIVNSNPVLIKGNFDGMYTDPAFGGTGSYATFKATKAARTAVLFAGGNDGMLHAFQDSEGVTPATDGKEIFAYVPRAVYPNLYKLTDYNYGTTSTLQHQYYVDGPLHEADAFVKAPGASSASWRNYLFGSLGAGGRAVFALDVTNSTSMGASSVRWELSSAEDDDIGYVLTPIKVGVLPNGRWVAIFGNGYSSANGKAVLFVVDIENAASSDVAVRTAAIQKLVLDSTGSNGLGGVTVIPNQTTGRTELIYVGDLKGKLWKIKYNTTTNLFQVDSNGTSGFFAAKDSLAAAQPITSSPVVYKHSLGGYMVIFGTGKLFSAADTNDTSTQTVYGVWDKEAGSLGAPDSISRPLARANLVPRILSTFAGTGGAAGTTFVSASGATVDYTGTSRGWYMDLSPTITGGRVIYPSQVVGYSTALVSSVAPVQGTPLACESGTGTALNLLLPVEQGKDSTSHSFDTNGDGIANGSDTTGIGYQTKADGVDAVVSSAGVSGSNRLADVGGGGPEGDCTGAVCSKKGQKCVPSPLCPEANTCLSSIQSATMGLPVCIPVGAGGTRVWRRIINPPIR